MTIIKQVKAREILDSRGWPALEAEVILLDGKIGRASVPSGASVGSQEALELRDKDSRYNGKGLKKAINNIQTVIAQELVGENVFNLTEIDNRLIKLDNSANKSNLGANTLLAVSLAAAKASALSQYKELFELFATKEECMHPVPLMNILNGGVHADNNIDLQEFMLVPYGAPDIAEAIRWGCEVYHVLKTILKQQSLTTAVGDEGGFAPMLKDNKHALDLLIKAVEQAGFSLSRDFGLALDLAASEFYSDGKYVLSAERKAYTSSEFAYFLAELLNNYPIVSMEDPMAEQDHIGWQELTDLISNKVQLVGDDLFVTNTKLLEQGIKNKMANAILIKPNQIGTLTETIAAIDMAKNNNYKVIISHRSGETEDNFISSLALGVSAGQIKVGAPARGERTSKYNQLLRVHDNYPKIPYAGKSFSG